jgi:hypothetical protein
LGQDFRILDSRQVKGPQIAADPIITSKIPLVLRAEQREWLDPASLEFFCFEFAVVELQLAPLPDR